MPQWPHTIGVHVNHTTLQWPRLNCPPLRLHEVSFFPQLCCYASIMAPIFLSLNHAFMTIDSCVYTMFLFVITQCLHNFKLSKSPELPKYMLSIDKY